MYVHMLDQMEDMWFALPFRVRRNSCQFIYREFGAIFSTLVGVILVVNKFKLIKMEVQIYLAFHYVRWIMPNVCTRSRSRSESDASEPSGASRFA